MVAASRSDLVDDGRGAGEGEAAFGGHRVEDRAHQGPAVADRALVAQHVLEAVALVAQDTEGAGPGGGDQLREGRGRVHRHVQRHDVGGGAQRLTGRPAGAPGDAQAEDGLPLPGVGVHGEGGGGGEQGGPAHLVAGGPGGQPVPAVGRQPPDVADMAAGARRGPSGGQLRRLVPAGEPRGPPGGVLAEACRTPVGGVALHEGVEGVEERGSGRRLPGGTGRPRRVGDGHPPDEVRGGRTVADEVVHPDGPQVRVVGDTQQVVVEERRPRQVVRAQAVLLDQPQRLLVRVFGRAQVEQADLPVVEGLQELHRAVVPFGEAHPEGLAARHDGTDRAGEQLLVDGAVEVDVLGAHVAQAGGVQDAAVPDARLRGGQRAAPVSHGRPPSPRGRPAPGRGRCGPARRGRPGRRGCVRWCGRRRAR